MIKNILNWIVRDWGYLDVGDFLASCFHIAAIKPILFVSIAFGTIATFIQNIIGLDPMVYIAFIVLIFVEFFTGVRASIREGNKFESKKMGRFVFKIGAYTILIGIVNIFKTKFQVPQIFGQQIHIYAWIYYIMLNMITIQLIISVLENYSRLGYRETNRVFRFITIKFDKWLNLKPEDNPESEE
jgi:hypothetical protein